MSQIVRIVQHRNMHHSKVKRNPSRKISLGCGSLLSILIGLSLAFVAYGYHGLVRDLPSLDQIPVYLDDQSGIWRQPTQIYDRSETHILFSLENPLASGHEYLPLDKQESASLPDTLVEATLATQDPTFWQNPGYSPAGLFEGTHPTIAQKLVFELLLRYEEPGLRRNFRERLLAAQLTMRFGRSKILEWYLNSVEYSQWTYGADAGAWAFFNKPASRLTLAEAALMAAASEAPGIHPARATQIVITRQQEIIHEMLSLGMISKDEALQASQESLNIQDPAAPDEMMQAVVDQVLQHISSHFPQEQIERGGWRIITTIDYDLQRQVTCAALEQVARLEQSDGDSSGIPEDCPAARLLSTISIPEAEKTARYNASAVILDPNNGQILALFGKSLLGSGPISPPGRPAGTLITPFIHLTAFRLGWSPASLILDIPSADWILPEDTDVTRYQGPMRLRSALVNDNLRVTERLLNDLGAENVMRTVRQLGIDGLTLKNHHSTGFIPQIQWDADQVTLVEITQAFSTFGNQGILVGQPGATSNSESESQLQATILLRLEDWQGQTFFDWSTPQRKPVVSAQLAYIMTHILSDETSRWPTLGHPNPLEIGRPAAAKIGQTPEKNDEWTVGYTPYLAVGVWIGNTTSNSQPVAHLASAALWHAILQYASQYLPVTGWSLPSGVNVIQVCDPSGLLPTTVCPTVVDEVFLNGSEPTQFDNLYQIYQINRETGRLATVFTPVELIEEKVFLVVPSEATEWAKSAALPVPPDNYDTIYAPSNPSTEVNIQNPALFAHVKGKVAFHGTASGEGFQYYRLQVGAGLNPQEWLQIGQDVTTPVEESNLGIWETSGLSGLYSVQLLVVHQDQRVERVITQLTVDNTPPEIRIQSPTANQVFKASEAIVIQAQIQDNLEIHQASFSIDGQEVSRLTQGPFILIWSGQPGKHILSVEARDLAGNTSEAKIQFDIK